MDQLYLGYKTSIKGEEAHLFQLVLDSQKLLFRERKVVLSRKLFLGPS